MFEIKRILIENMEEGCVTDSRNPRISWTVESDRNGAEIASQRVKIGSWEKVISGGQQCTYSGEALRPFSEYCVTITVASDKDEVATREARFETGFLGSSKRAGFITDGNYSFTEKKVSPKVMTFRKRFTAGKTVKRARLYATAIGTYRIDLNGSKVGKDFLTPGFTSYKTNLQYQTYDVTDMLSESNEIIAHVAGGWAVGSFVYSRANRVTDDKQSFWCELHIEYEDGIDDTVITDESWKVSLDGPFLEADLYDGEVYDARRRVSEMHFRPASVRKLSFNPSMEAGYGCAVREHEEFKPISVSVWKDEYIYDFGQNFAGLVHLEIDGHAGESVTVRHAEILHPDGSLNTDFLRSAKARLEYTCREGYQEYCPTFTYMGFRYVSVKGIDRERIKVTARALYSDVRDNGSFSCSDKMLNRLQENIRWGAKSNFVDIPTDCPQRDERMGWTGDIALFARTAAYNFDMGRFFDKWLRDMRAEQKPTGGIPGTIPSGGFGFPVTMPSVAVDFWGDASVLVPYAEYLARGDEKILSDNYEMMKKYVDACRWWAQLFSFGKKRYLWNTHHMLHFGDWVAPDVSQMQQWQKRSKWTATASLSNTSALLSRIADILGKNEDAAKYSEISKKAADAYRTCLTDGAGKLKEEFQTAYVLPIYFDMFEGKEKQKAADNLAELVRKNNYRIGTGFPGTPYILFALADNGHQQEAFEMLMCKDCPSWLYEVKMGATTIWERWDGLDENGNCPIGDDGTDVMISYNHYASGAVGDFLYRRVAGIEPLEAGYKRFAVKPLVGGGLTSACGRLNTPYGEIMSSWEILEDDFRLEVKVPVGSSCKVTLPDGAESELASGQYVLTCKVLLTCHGD